MNIGDLFLALRGDGTLLQQDVMKAGDKAGQTFGQKFGATLKQNATRLAAGGGAAAGAFIAGSTQEFARFDDQMRELFSIMPGISQAAMDQMEDDVLAVSKQYGILTEDLIPALQTAIGSGVPEENALSFMETAAKAAAAGATDAETSTLALVGAINAFHLPVEDANIVADKFFNAIDKGADVTFPDLAASMSQVSPQAAAMGISLEDVLGAVTAMSLQGTPTSEAITDIGAAMKALQRTTPEMDKALAHLGFSTGQAAVDALGFQGTLEALRGEADKNGVALIDLTGRGEGAAAMFQLTGENSAKANEMLGTFADTGGKVDAAFKTMEGGVGGFSRRIVANLKAVAIELGDSLQLIGPLFIAFGPQVGRLLGGAIGAGAGVAMRFAGPAIAKLGLAIAEKLGIEVASSAGASKALTGAMEALPTGPAGKAASAAGQKMGGLLGKGMALGIIAVGAVAIYESQKSQYTAVEGMIARDLDKFTKDLTDQQLKDLQKNLTESIASPLGQLQTGISGIFGSKGVTAQLDQVNAAIAARAAAAEGAVHGVARGISRDLDDPRIGEAAEAAGDAIEDGIGGGAEDATTAVETAAGAILTAISGLRSDVGSAASAAANAIFDPFIKGRALAQTKKDLAEQHDIIMDKDSTKKQVREARLRTAELGKQLIVQLSDMTTYGDTATRIAAIKAALATEAVAEAYANGTPEQRAAIDEWRRVLTGQMTELQGEAATGGTATGESYAGGLEGTKGTVSGAATTAVAGVDNALKMGPEARGWGTNVGNAWVGGAVAAIRAGKGRFNEAVSTSTAAMHGKSPPKEGPLQHIDDWGANIMNAWAGGMLSAVGSVRRSASTLAAAAVPRVSPLSVGSMAMRASPSVPGALGASSVAAGGDVYNIKVPIEGLIKARDPLEVAGQLRRLADLGVLSPKRPAYR